MILPSESFSANITGIWSFIGMRPFVYQQIVRFSKLSMAVFTNKLLLWSRTRSSGLLRRLSRSSSTGMQFLQIHRRMITPRRLMIQSRIPNPLIHQYSRVRSRRRQTHISSQRRMIRIRSMRNFVRFVLEQVVLMVRRFVVHQWMRRRRDRWQLRWRLLVLVVHPRMVLLGHTMLLGHVRFLIQVLDCRMACFWRSWRCWKSGTSRFAFYAIWRYCRFVICENRLCYWNSYEKSNTF